MSNVDLIADVYRERNAVVSAFAWAMFCVGANVGWLLDSQEGPDWPVVVIDTPMGQVSWHVQRADLPDWMEPYPGEWDGHTTEEKYARLAAMVDTTPRIGGPR